MKNTKSKISPPKSIEDFADDVLQYAKEEATIEELAFIKAEIREMTKNLKKNRVSQKSGYTALG